MVRLNSIAELNAISGPVHLAIGVFDGVHLGHQEVIRRALEAAEIGAGTAVVLSFDPHPVVVLQPEQAPRILTPTEHKELIMARLGVTHLLVIRFTRDFASKTAEQFIAELRDACELASISVGEGWTFGKNRTGNVPALTLFGQRDGFEVHAIQPVSVDGELVSSTRVRQAVESGNLELCRRLLGRDFSLLGTVVPGRHMGRRLGFPTANIDLRNEQLPPIGVYAVWALHQGQWRPGVANLGFRPTVSQGEKVRTFEVHLLDYTGDLYGQTLKVRLVKRLRDELKLPDLDALKRQIATDCQQARLALGLAGLPESSRVELREAEELILED